MRRALERPLTSWLHSHGRKPLVLRGSRQVGKTWLVRELAGNSDKELIELNFERRPDARVVGQQLRLRCPLSGDGPRLYYWKREGGRPGEVDFLLQHANRIVPVELKSGAAGAMKGLHQFMFDKKLSFAVRIDSNPPSDTDLAVKTTQGNPVRYHLRSIPHYLAGFANAFGA